MGDATMVLLDFDERFARISTERAPWLRASFNSILSFRFPLGGDGDCQSLVLATMAR